MPICDELLRNVNVPIFTFLAYRIAKNWVAGKSVEDALREAKLANMKGFSVVLNYLGEEIESVEEVQSSVEEYGHLLKTVHAARIDGCVSVKLTQLGLNIDRNYCRKNLQEIVDRASSLDLFVWIDMESSKFTQDTIDIYTSIFSESKNVGICIQSYLKRSERDLENIVKVGGKVRLVKGAYNEAASIAFKSKKEINENYLKLMEYLFRDSASLFSIATHDDRLVCKAVEMNEKYDRTLEFGMLKGIRDKLKLELVRKGCRVTEYIPYGENWLPFSIRRIREKPSNVLLLGRSLLSK